MDPLPASAPADTSTTAAPLRTAVVALGSIVMGDDGAGAAALAALDDGWELPDEVDLLDLGTPGPYFAEYLRGYDAVVVLDALAADGTPGEIRIYDGDALPAGPAGTRMTPHAVDLGAARATLEFEGGAPGSWTVLGIVPGEVQAGISLTPAVRAAVPRLAQAAAETLGRLGHRLSRRTDPAARPRWWEPTRPSAP